MDISCIWCLQLPLTSSSHMLMTILCIIDHYILDQIISMVFLKPSGKSHAAKFLPFVLVLHDVWPSHHPPPYSALTPPEAERTLLSLFCSGREIYFSSTSPSFHKILLRFSIPGLSTSSVPVEGEHEIEDSGGFLSPFLCEELDWNKNWNSKRLTSLITSSAFGPSVHIR